jgi:predicted ATPase/class 3 adenylate cyclase/Tfp pilus assembly protein PilF
VGAVGERGAAPAPAPPAGTVTFLFTDLEGSTRLLEAHPDAYREAVRRHHELLREAVDAHGGVVFETMGDAVYAAFARPTAAVRAALAGQRALQAEPWGATGPLRVRMGLHLGEVERQGGHYFGAPLYRCARLLATAHGGQTVLSGAVAEVVRDALPADAGLRDLGEHRLRDLQRPERLFQLGHPDLPVDFPPLRSLDALPHNLPVQLTSFVGRARELAEVRQLLSANRLVTLTGAGGVGKTRLALRAAAELHGAFPDGAWLISLAPVADPALVPSAIAQALGVREAGGRTLAEGLRDHLRDKRLLLIVDNCEHLLPGAAPAVTDLLAAAPRLKVLATSRAPLRLAGEREYPVPPLRLPDPPAPARPPDPAALARSEAVALFAERAAAVAPAFAVTAETAEAVAGICRRLDGLPLALELAAVRTKVLPPAALLARLEHRLPLLTGGPRDLPARHQTLRASIAWSHDLLAPAEQTLFRRLAVFAGGCTLDAAEAVCDPGGDLPLGALDGLASLVDKSLVLPDEETSSEPRFAMLETLREYAAERLAASAEAAAIRRRHLAYYLALVERAEPRLRGPQQTVWLDRLEREHANLRAALMWCTEAPGAAGRAEMGLRLAGALWRFWDVRCYVVEGRWWLERVLETYRRRSPARVKALIGAGALAWRQDDGAAAQARYEEGLALARELGDKQSVATALNSLGFVALSSRNYAIAHALHEEGLALARELGDKQNVATALNRLGLLARYHGDYAAARRLHEESVAIRRELGDKQGVATALNNLAVVARQQGDYARARSLAEESLALHRAVGDRHNLAATLRNLGQIAYLQGRFAEAQPYLEHSLALSKDLGQILGIVEALVRMANIARARGDYARARSLSEEAVEVASRGGDQGGEGAPIAQALQSLAAVARLQGDAPRAHREYQESLRLFRDAGDTHGIATSLEGLAAVASDEGRWSRALQLVGAAGALRQAIGAPVPLLEREQVEHVRAAARRELGQLAAEDASNWGRALTVEQAVADALEDVPADA